jgi:hypothetical protein
MIAQSVSDPHQRAESKGIYLCFLRCVVWTLYSDLVGWQRPVDNETDRVGSQSGRGYPNECAY